PIVTGVLFGAGAEFGLLAGGLAAGVAMAVMMANAGGAWGNAKKGVGRGGLAEQFTEEGRYNPAVEDAALAPVKGDQGGPDGKKGGKKGKKGKTSARNKSAEGGEAKAEEGESAETESTEEESAAEEAAAESTEEAAPEETPAVSPTAPAPEAPAPVAAKAEAPSEPPLVVSTTAPAPTAAPAAPKKKYKKYVKGSPEHKATVVGDTVGDPFKDTSGPSLNILVKLMSMVAVATVALVLAVNKGGGLLPWLFELI